MNKQSAPRVKHAKQNRFGIITIDMLNGMPSEEQLMPSGP